MQPSSPFSLYFMIRILAKKYIVDIWKRIIKNTNNLNNKGNILMNTKKYIKKSKDILMASIGITIILTCLGLCVCLVAFTISLIVVFFQAMYLVYTQNFSKSIIQAGNSKDFIDKFLVNIFQHHPIYPVILCTTLTIASIVCLYSVVYYNGRTSPGLVRCRPLFFVCTITYIPLPILIGSNIYYPQIREHYLSGTMALVWWIGSVLSYLVIPIIARICTHIHTHFTSTWNNMSNHERIHVARKLKDIS